MAKSLANNKQSTQGKPHRWKKGESGNPKGAPKRGESWAEVIKRFGEMTPAEASAHSLELSQKFLSIGEGVTLKQAVVLRVYGSLLFEPDARLLNAFMDRAEGKVTQPISNVTDNLMQRLQELGLTLDDVRNDTLASELFRLAGVRLSE